MRSWLCCAGAVALAWRPSVGLLHAAKRRHLRDLADRLERIVAAVESALAAPRVLKGELAAAVNQEARWAQAELYNLCAFIGSMPLFGLNDRRKRRDLASDKRLDGGALLARK